MQHSSATSFLVLAGRRKSQYPEEKKNIYQSYTTFLFVLSREEEFSGV